MDFRDALTATRKERKQSKKCGGRGDQVSGCFQGVRNKGLCDAYILRSYSGWSIDWSKVRLGMEALLESKNEIADAFQD